MRDHSHYSSEDAGVCSRCGQPLPAGHGHVHAYGDKRANATGLAVTVLLHLLLLAAFLLRPQVTKPPPTPPGGSVAYVAPLAKPKPPPRPPPERAPRKQAAPARVEMARLPNTISLPNEQPPAPEAEPPKIVKVEPEQDMAAMIEARRRARGQVEQPAEESEAERGNRLARANIAAASGRGNSSGSGKGRAGLAVVSMSFSTAEVQFDIEAMAGRRGRLIQLTVDLGGESDIETAIIKKMTQLMQAAMTEEFTFTYGNPERKVKLSTRPEHTAELAGTLMKVYFPEYRPARR